MSSDIPTTFDIWQARRAKLDEPRVVVHEGDVVPDEVLEAAKAAADRLFAYNERPSLEQLLRGTEFEHWLDDPPDSQDPT